MYRVLLIHPDPDLRAALQAMLLRAGFTVFTDAPETAILPLLQLHQPDVLVLAHVAGQGLTRQICETVKNHQPAKRLPIIVFDAGNREQHIQHNFACDVFLPMTAELADLIMEINSLVHRKKQV